MSCGVARYDWKPFISTVFLSVSFHSFRTELTLLASNLGLVSNPSWATIVDIVMDSFAYWVPINLAFIPKNNLGLPLLPQSIFLRRLYESYIMIHPLCISSLKQLIKYICLKRKLTNNLCFEEEILFTPRLPGSPYYFLLRRCIVPNSVRRPPDAINPEDCPSVHLMLRWPPVIVFVRSRRSYGNT